MANRNTQAAPTETLDPESERHLRNIERRFEGYAERTAFVVRIYFSMFSATAAVLSHLGGRPRIEMIEQLTAIGAYFVFCVSMHQYLGRARRYHPSVKYVSSFVDIALLTILTWFTTTSQNNPILSYFTPMTLIFFVFITMSAVRNRLRVTALTLALAVTAYGGLMIAAYPEMRALNVNLAEATEELAPAIAASGAVFKLPSGRPMGIILRLLYMSLAGGLLLYAMYGARRTARQQTAYLLEQKALQHAEIDRIKTNFFLNMSHEFRTPLTLILGPIERLLAAGETISAKNRNELLQLIFRSGHNMLANVNNLLDFSRLEAGKLKLQPERFELVAHLRAIVDAFRFESERKNLELILEHPEGPLPVVVDPYLIERALSNLIANAIRFTDTGTIAVRVRSTTDLVQIQVEDSGPGIPPERAGRIFERFDTGAASGGTGLGLPLTREIVERHGGRIRLATPAAGGACFTIEIPGELQNSNNTAAYGLSQPAGHDSNIAMPHADSTPPVGVARAPAPSRDETAKRFFTTNGGLADVLLVEDHADMREFIAGILRPHYNVRSVPNGQAALEDVRRRMPDLIVTDLMMPEMNGLMLLELLRAERETANLPVILLTARSESADRIEGLKSGADDYLTKPFVPDELLQRAQNLIQRARSVDANLARERHQIYADLHDNLGAQLTDLAMQARRMNPNVLSAADFEQFNATVSRAHHSLRKALSDAEDLERMRTDYPLGLQLFLLRRYTSCGRQLDWQLNPEVNQILTGPLVTEHIRRSLFAILREVITNDLKYGHGTSRLKFEQNDTPETDAFDSEHAAGLRKNRGIRIDFEAPTGYGDAAETGTGSGWGQNTIAERAAELNGSIEVSLRDGRYYFTLEIPLYDIAV